MKVYSGKEVAEEYTSSLADLTVNSKPLINMLTMLAEDYIEHAPIIVKVVELHLHEVPSDIKLPVLYLIDSIVKNVGKEYVNLFTQNIVSTFCTVFEKVDEKVRAQMFKLRQTWNEVFPSKKLFALDARVHAIDPAWPITANPSPSVRIHVNPKFLQAHGPSPILSSTELNQPNDDIIREELLKQQRELLELQKKKVELELLQTKAILEEQQKKLESQTAVLAHDPSPSTSGISAVVSPLKPSPDPAMPLQVAASSSSTTSKLGEINSFRFRDPRIKIRNQDNKNKTSLSHKGSRHKKETDSKREKSKKSHKKTKEVHSQPNTDSTEKKSVEVKQKNTKVTFEEELMKNEIDVKPGVSSDNSSSLIYDNKTLSDKYKEKPFEFKEKSNSLKQLIDIKIKNTQEQSKHMPTDSTSTDFGISTRQKQSKENEITKSDKLHPEREKEFHSSVATSYDPVSSALKDKSELDNVNFVCLSNEILQIPKGDGTDFVDKQNNDSVNLNVNMENIKKISGVKRLHSRSPSPHSNKNINEGRQSLDSDINSDVLPPSRKKSPSSNDFSPANHLTINNDLNKMSNSDKDIDLRLLPSSPVCPSEETNSSKKLKTTEMFDSLFGNEDVDLRMLAPLGSNSVSASLCSTPQPSVTSSQHSDSSPSNPSSAAIKSGNTNFVNFPSKSTSPSVSCMSSPKKRATSPMSRKMSPGKCSTPDSSNSVSISSPPSLIDEPMNTTLNSDMISIVDLTSPMKSSSLSSDHRESRTSSPSCSKIPTPPPPPTISSHGNSKKESTWANFKRNNTDMIGASPQTASHKYQRYKDRTPRSFAHHRYGPIDKDIENDSKENSSANFNLIIKEAEEQVKSGNITFSQYSRMVKEVVVINEERKLQEAVQKHSRERISEKSSSLNSTEATSEYTANNVMPLQVNPHYSGPIPNSLPHPVYPNNGYDPSVNELQPDNRNKGPFFYNDGNTFRGVNTYGGPPGMCNTFIPNIHPMLPDIPPADPQVLELIEKDSMRPINIDGNVREVRYYGETAVIMLNWDDPREVTFAPGSRKLIVDDCEQFNLHFNAPYRDCTIDGRIHRIRLGAPTRELCIDGLYYKTFFGGPIINVMLGDRLRKLQLLGPMPKVRIGVVPRTDFVVGKINLIVDAKHMFPIYLDAKPQRFEVDGIPFILRFVEAFQTVVINGVPFKFEFGGVPIPIHVNGKIHYLRLSVLPQNVKPGFTTVVNMEGGRMPFPPPAPMFPPVPLGTAPLIPPPNEQLNPNFVNFKIPENDQPLELLTSLMPTTVTPFESHSYSLESNTSAPIESQDVSGNKNPLGSINVGELYQKLVASGIVPSSDQKEDSNKEDSCSVKPVDFSKPETLKVKQPSLVTRLYSGIQCSSCGVRFPPEQTVKYSQHLDWHFRQNRREKDSVKIAQSRCWNYPISDWIQYQEIEDIEDRAASWFEMQEKNNLHEKEGGDTTDVPTVATDRQEPKAVCQVCSDPFEEFYSEEKEEWQLKNAVRVDGFLYHPICHPDFKKNHVKLNAEDPIVHQEDETVIIEDTINLDDEPSAIDVDKKESDMLVDKSADEVNVDLTVDEFKKIEDETEKNSEEIPINAENNMEITVDEEDVTVVEIDEVNENSLNKNISDHDNSDDDILQIEVVERPIEFYEILDDEDEEVNVAENNKMECEIIEEIKEDTQMSQSEEENDDNIDFSTIKVKTEKIDLSEHVSVPNQVMVVSSIDGNVELEDATTRVLPAKKIKINISSKHMQQQQQQKSAIEELPVSDVASTALRLEPPPPGEELIPATLKPKLVGAKMNNREPVFKGNELSGLCSIM